MNLVWILFALFSISILIAAGRIAYLNGKLDKECLGLVISLHRCTND